MAICLFLTGPLWLVLDLPMYNQQKSVSKNWITLFSLGAACFQRKNVFIEFLLSSLEYNNIFHRDN